MSREDTKKRIVLTGYIIIAVFLLVFMRLWQLQVLQGKRLRELTESNKIKVLKIAAPRGIIYDREGRALVKNTPYYSASLIPAAIGEVDTKALARLLHMEEADVVEKLSSKVPPFEAIKIKEGISLREVAYIEARRSDFPGLIIETEGTRHYVYGDVGAHVVGYLGKPGPEKLRRFSDSDIPPDAFIGTWGAEAYFDEHLRGKPGRRYIEVDALGRQLRIVREEPPIKGEDLVLSLDIELQRTIEDAFGGRAGAAVAIDPSTGGVLSLVSLPSFNPNLFARGISAADWDALNRNPYHPFLNRALQSQYPPGSVFKLVVAAAALEEGLLPEDFTVTCRGSIRYGRWSYRCWRRGGHGVVDLHRAIVESCDIYFYEVGRMLGIDTIASYARRFGLAMPTGFDLVEEKTGFVPTTEWKHRTRHEEWYVGETYHASIGQGYVLATPFQQAMLATAIANNGIVHKPVLLRDSEPSDVLRRILLMPGTFATLKEAMKGVVNEQKGTAYWTARSARFIIAGKTGTAQVIREREVAKKDDLPEKFRDHAWFIAFAPYERPVIAMSVFVEHGGHGSSAAAPIAKKAIDYYLAAQQLKAGPDGEGREP